jgi:methylamine dehydrogenase heavy chain
MAEDDVTRESWIVFGGALAMRRRPWAGALFAAIASPALVLAQSANTVPQAEQFDVATLAPQYPHRLFTSSPGYGSGSFLILNGDTLSIEGSISGSRGVLAVDPGGRNYYVCETIWTLGNRGTRQDMVTVYDGRTLNLSGEIPIPGRLLVGVRTHNCDISASGKFAYVYNMQPASSVIVVDLKQRRVASVIEIPGCANAFPWGDEGFASLCGDGTLATSSLSAQGQPGKLAHSARFFDADSDPIFEESLVDRTSGRAYFLSYTGLIYPAQLSDQPTIEQPWSLQEAAGLPRAGTGVQELAWRPGGVHMIAWHKATNRLYVLMHVGAHWSHRALGTELWIVDAAAHKVLKRVAVPEPMNGVAISQDDNPLLYVVGRTGEVYTLDPQTGQQKMKGDGHAGSLMWVPGF